MTDADTYEVPPDWAGQRLDRFLGVHGISRAEAKRLVARSAIAVQGRPVPKVAWILRAGDVVSVLARSASNFDPIPSDPDSLTVVFEDAHCVVLLKPAGQASHPLRSDEVDTLANALAAYCPETVRVGESRRDCGLLHRLDTGTSGLLLAAKTRTAFEWFRAAQARDEFEKGYVALCEGVPELGKIESPLAHRGPRMALDDDGRDACTEVLAAERRGGISRVTLKLRRGARHQIRVHLASLGHSIVGDQTYGQGHPLLAEGRHALHASSLHVPGPDGPVDVSAEWPADMATLWESEPVD